MPKTLTLDDISNALAGRLIGDGAMCVTRPVHPADWRDEGDLALAMDSKLLPLLEGKAIRAVLVADENAATAIPNRIIVARPRLAMAKLTALFAEPVPIAKGIHPSAIIEPSARIGKNPSIGAMVYIGAEAVIGDNANIHPHVSVGPNAHVGDDALIYSGARIGHATQIGARVIIHFNAAIGADGFSFVTPHMGSVEVAKAGTGGTVTAANTALIRIASLAPVIIGDDVEIGANSCIDRGTVASTRIGSGTKIDNQVQIGHNVAVGDNCMLCGRVGIAGSAHIGNRVVLGGGVGVADHVQIGDDAIVMAMSGVAGNVPAKSIVGGLPAMPRETVMENLFNLGRLKRLFKKVDELAARVDTIAPADK